MTQGWGRLRVAAALLPGKLPTFAGPLLLYQALPTADYAAFEVVVVAASLLATVLAAGRPALLPYEVIECQRGDALSVMRAALGHWGWALWGLGVAALALTPSSTDADTWRWLSCLALLCVLTACLLAQACLAAVMKLRGHAGLSAFAEHGIWTTFAAAVLLAWVWNRPLGLTVLQMLALAHTAALLTLALAALRPARDPSAAPAAIARRLEPRASSLMLAQLATIAGLALTRTVFLLAGEPDLSAQSALAFRLALPVVFAAQASHVAGLGELFSSQAQRKSAAIEAAMLTILAVSVGMFALLHALQASLALPLFPIGGTFNACLALALSTTAILATRDLVGVAAVGRGSSMRRGLVFAAALPVAAALVAAVVSAARGATWALYAGMFASWATLATVSGCQIGRLVSARAKRVFWVYVAGTGVASAVLEALG